MQRQLAVTRSGMQFGPCFWNWNFPQIPLVFPESTGAPGEHINAQAACWDLDFRAPLGSVTKGLGAAKTLKTKQSPAEFLQGAGILPAETPPQGCIPRVRIKHRAAEHCNEWGDTSCSATAKRGRCPTQGLSSACAAGLVHLCCRRKNSKQGKNKNKS